MRKESSARVTRWRRATKLKLVEIHGGKCKRCGYNKCIRALQFHHVNPSDKKFALSCCSIQAFDKLVAEASKCELLCANCHAEIEESLLECASTVQGATVTRVFVGSNPTAPAI